MPLLSPLVADLRSDRCRHALSVFALLPILSIGFGNVLVLQRVVILWDRRTVRIAITLMTSLSDVGKILDHSESDGSRVFSRIQYTGHRYDIYGETSLPWVPYVIYLMKVVCSDILWNVSESGVVGGRRNLHRHAIFAPASCHLGFCCMSSFNCVATCSV